MHVPPSGQGWQPVVSVKGFRQYVPLAEQRTQRLICMWSQQHGSQRATKQHINTTLHGQQRRLVMNSSQIIKEQTGM
jgi:hypothetical protein